MSRLKQILRCKFFSEENDVGEGPRWAVILLVAAVSIGYAAFFAEIAAFIAGNREGLILAWAIFIAAFALRSGAAWHLDMPGRAKNGLVMAVIGAATLCML